MTYVASAVGYAAAAKSVSASSTLNLTAGDVLVAYFSYDGTASSIGFSDGGSNTFTVVSPSSQSVWVHIDGGYLLSASANSTATITASNSNDLETLSIVVLQFRPGSGETVTYQAGPGYNSDTWWNYFSSTNVSASESDSVFVGGIANGGGLSLSSMNIAGSSAGGTVSEANDYLHAGYSIFSATQTSKNMTGYISSDNTWSAMCLVLDIEEGAAGGALPMAMNYYRRAR